MAKMFYGSAATTIDLSGFDASNVTNMSGMFSASKTTSIIFLEEWTTGENTDMSRMFERSAATSLDLSGLDTSNVINMSRMFWASSAESIDLSGFDTSKVTNMSYMFAGSAATTGYAKTQADADKFNDASVTSIPSTLTFTVKTNSGSGSTVGSPGETPL